MQIVSGVVVEGQKKGRQLGYPTANIMLSEPVVEEGIYAGRGMISGNQYLGAVFINPGGNLFEVYFLDFDGDLYGQILEVEVGKKIRDSKQFDSEEKLKAQIAEDVEKIRHLGFNS